MWLFLASKIVKSHTHIARLYEKDPIFNTRVVNMYMLDAHRSVYVLLRLLASSIANLANSRHVILAALPIVCSLRL